MYFEHYWKDKNKEKEAGNGPEKQQCVNENHALLSVSTFVVASTII